MSESMLIVTVNEISEAWIRAADNGWKKKTAQRDYTYWTTNIYEDI